MTLIIWGRDVDRFYNPDIEKLILYEGSEKGTEEKKNGFFDQ